MQGSANLNLMIKAARKAGRSLVKDFREVENLQVSLKGAGDFVSRADVAAEKIIKDNKDSMIRLAEALLEFETLDAVQIRRVVAGLPLDRDDSPSTTDDGGTPETEGTSKNPFNKPILPTPATV